MEDLYTNMEMAEDGAALSCSEFRVRFVTRVSALDAELTTIKLT